VEITREVARRFNHIYAGPEFEQKVEKAIKSLARETPRCIERCAKSFRRRAMRMPGSTRLVEANPVSRSRIAIVIGFLEGAGIAILPEPRALLTATPSTGLDGRKMPSLRQPIGLREDNGLDREETQGHANRSGRVRRTDPGDPEKCPVWDLHKILFDCRDFGWVRSCRSAGIVFGVQGAADRESWRGVRIAKRAQEFEENPTW